jgi:hypothetical protein
MACARSFGVTGFVAVKIFRTSRSKHTAAVTSGLKLENYARQRTRQN